ncbi:MAG: hypothetical protein J6Y37_07355 [Paludibacteraceae bacterium]|nr:hypothetical protein [Paludibacteraceae bacterium]
MAKKVLLLSLVEKIFFILSAKIFCVFLTTSDAEKLRWIGRFWFFDAKKIHLFLTFVVHFEEVFSFMF